MLRAYQKKIMEFIEYRLTKDEDYRDFLSRTLKGQVDKKSYQLFIILLELIITEVKESTYSLTLTLKTKEIDLTISHKGNGIKDSILNIIDDQVDYLRYRRLAKDSHQLKIRKNIEEYV